VRAVYPSRLGYSPILRDFIGYVVEPIPGVLWKLQQPFEGFLVPA
jgi:hypothetical protein